MSSDSNAQASPGVARRSVTKTAAWSVPAISVALPAPTLAASTATIDLAVETQPFGDGVSGFSPDRLRMFDLILAGGFDVTNLESAPAPAGSVVTLSFDRRLFTGATLTAATVAIASSGSQTNGNLMEVTFDLPTAIPVGGLVNLRPSLTRVAELPWAEDFEPYTVAVAPASGSVDAVAANNSVSFEPRYYDTSDAALSATWRQHDLTTGAGAPLPIDVQDTVTITANAPGDVPADSSLTIGGPTVSDGNGWTTAFEGVTIVSAMLGGVDVSDQFVQDPVSPGADVFSWRIGVAIPAGEQLVVDVDVDVKTATRESVYSGAWTQFSSSRDRDDSNQRADTGPTP